MIERICKLNDITINTGVVALYNEKQVAIFRVSDTEIYAIDNFDPFSHANILSRGIIGQDQGQLFVASPLYKQRFNLQSGQCLDDEDVKINAYETKIIDQEIYIDA
ncbi:MAG: nitrite reductase small subunit NirD [bacterium]|nr:nitrite reductase small subunit NirD [bacterium]